MTQFSGGDPFQLVIVTNAPGTQAPPLASGSGTGKLSMHYEKNAHAIHREV